MTTSPLRSWRAAWMLLTRIPLPQGRVGASGPDHDAVRAAPVWFPVVGATIGASVGVVYAMLFDLIGAFTAAAVAVSVGALLTGALHQDGLADVADAFGGGWTVERRLEILKDSHIGTYGTLALVCAFGVQTSALAQHDRAEGLAILVAAHTLGRGGIVVLMLVAPRASSTGLGASYSRGLGRAATAGAACGALLIGALVLGPLVLFAAATAGLAVVLMGALAWRKIRGVTGDVLGAAEQLAETAVLVTGAAFVRHADNWPNGPWPWWH